MSDFSRTLNLISGYCSAVFDLLEKDLVSILMRAILWRQKIHCIEKLSIRRHSGSSIRTGNASENGSAGDLFLGKGMDLVRLDLESNGNK